MLVAVNVLYLHGAVLVGDHVRLVLPNVVELACFHRVVLVCVLLRVVRVYNK